MLKNIFKKYRPTALTPEKVSYGMKCYAEDREPWKGMHVDFLMLYLREGLREMSPLEFTNKKFHKIFKKLIKRDSNFYVNERDPNIFHKREEPKTEVSLSEVA